MGETRGAEGGDHTMTARRSRARWIAFVGAMGACVAVGYTALPVRAAGTPQHDPLVYSGVLEEDGEPVTGLRPIGLRLFDAAAGGAVQCSVDVAVVDVNDGYFSVVLGDDCQKAIHERPDLWVELQVNGDALLPRTKIAAVPYALEAGRATFAVGSLRAEIDSLKSSLNAVGARLSALEEKSRPRTFVTRDARQGCPPGDYTPDTDLLAHSFSTAGPATLHASVNIIACVGGRIDLYLYVDGAEVGRTLASPNGGGGDCWVGMYADALVEVGPGDHTVSARGSVPGTFGCGEAWGHLDTTVFE